MPVYAINFRREAFQQQLRRARERAVRLGLWVLYFGALGVVLGLYGLNCASLSERTSRIERQVARLRQQSAGDANWRPKPEDVMRVSLYLRDPRLWQARLTRLPQLLPPNAKLTALQFNPDNVSGSADAKLMLTGELRAGGGDRMQAVMEFVNTLARDSVFASGYSNVRLVTTRANASGDGAEFVVECR
ncbi:MAG: hypothetical protein HZA61_01070 [Candidatus Eisenbacteria bacterium]|uniref:PilN domain-containing protein n=1 Tax=Eiseniibacteriota bacterium TaxID=2212470 RepID=A0A933W7M2_UNCEI|nr:hypothetical protein [Candidatus Eisenbacteria bacterium]